VRGGLRARSARRHVLKESPMKRFAAWLVLGVVICVVPQRAWPDRGDDPWGAGVHSCREWLSDAPTASRKLEMKQWIYGFAAGINFDTKGPKAKLPDTRAADAFVDQYCTNNPHDALVYAAAALVEVSGGPKTVHRWKKKPPRGAPGAPD
jgi:hypothetical protein